MPITTDFLLLYDELKVTPDCSLDHFKRAYRRRVADLHPDRVSGKANPAATARLQTLTRLHDEAMRFHGYHGRLPGANQAAHIAPAETPMRMAAHAAKSRSPARSILVAALILAGAAVAWILLPDEPADIPAEPDHVSSAQTRQPNDGGDFLIVGMDEGGVRRIQGEPAFLATDRWEYGPSYVRFDRHKVVGWYSSPLYPLKTGAPHQNASKTAN
ncbi:MAG TPA: J domain-containing protein [Rudaea sp.]|jgi:hypothetical protein|nr:J domain-containing protein [Rudaea sp.]